MSALRVNNVNVGGTSVDGVIQQVDSQGTPNTAGNKITLKTDGTNIIDGDTVLTGNTTTKYIPFAFPQSNINTEDYYGQVVNFSNGETVTISSVSATGGGGILTIINSGSTAVTINKSAVLTIHIGTGVVTASSLSLAQYGMCTIYAISTGTWISGVGLS